MRTPPVGSSRGRSATLRRACHPPAQASPRDPGAGLVGGSRVGTAAVPLAAMGEPAHRLTGRHAAPVWAAIPTACPPGLPPPPGSPCRREARMTPAMHRSADPAPWIPLRLRVGASAGLAPARRACPHAAALRSPGRDSANPARAPAPCACTRRCWRSRSASSTRHARVPVRRCAAVATTVGRASRLAVPSRRRRRRPGARTTPRHRPDCGILRR